MILIFLTNFVFDLDNEKLPMHNTYEEFLTLESELCELVQSGNLHWRHQQMALGMLLSMICSGHKPSVTTLDLWLECLIHDDRNIRCMAFQVSIFQRNNNNFDNI